MEEYLQKLSAYIAEHPPDSHSDGGDTILDALFWAYCESAGGDSEGVQQAYDSLLRWFRNIGYMKVKFPTLQCLFIFSMLFNLIRRLIIQALMRSFFINSTFLIIAFFICRHKCRARIQY